MIEYLFKINDKVRIKYYVGTNDKMNLVYTITNKSYLTTEAYTKVCTYVLEAMYNGVVKEVLIDESYLEYDCNYLRQLKLKQLM